MPSSSRASHPVISSPSNLYQSDKSVLSLELMETRNATLHWVGQMQVVKPDLCFVPEAQDQSVTGVLPPLWLLGYVGWFQQWWIVRHTQRELGERCSPDSTRLACIDPLSDTCFNPQLTTAEQRWTQKYPSPEVVKSYLMETLEMTLELLDKAENSDQALYFFRLALARENQVCELLAMSAQALGLKLPMPEPPSLALREPICLPARLHMGGTPAGTSGFVWDNERGHTSLHVPDFEIDAQAVSWAQYVEFVSDGGYDHRDHWSGDGWNWLQEQAKLNGRRGPRYVDQIGKASGAVVVQRFGTACRAASGQAAMHVTWYEADAYARWAGRRLPTEIEWEIAANHAQGMGFRWGHVWEWTMNTFRAYEGFVAGPWENYSVSAFECCKVLKGGSFLMRDSKKFPHFRGFALPHEDAGFVGFRTCAR